MDIVGIDPGQSGGIALLHDEGPPLVWKMPATEKDVYILLSDHVIPAHTHAYLERVAAMPKQGVSSTFKFGQHYGMLRAFLVALEIPFTTVTPGVWQRRLGCLSKGDKNVTKAKAQEQFPNIKVTHATADALLIALYGRGMQGAPW